MKDAARSRGRAVSPQPHGRGRPRDRHQYPHDRGTRPESHRHRNPHRKRPFAPISSRADPPAAAAAAVAAAAVARMVRCPALKMAAANPLGRRVVLGGKHHAVRLTPIGGPRGQTQHGCRKGWTGSRLPLAHGGVPTGTSPHPVRPRQVARTACRSRAARNTDTACPQSCELTVMSASAIHWGTRSGRRGGLDTRRRP